MCLLFETIKIVNNVPQNILLHEERMNRSRKELLDISDHISPGDFIKIPEDSTGSVDRCKIVYGRTVNSVEFSSYTPAKVSFLKIVKADELIYDHKYLDRNQLTSLVDRQSAHDILIIRNNLVTDASYANIVFYDGRNWITPDSPLLNGTMRTHLLRAGLIREARITVDDIMNYSHFRLINAMLGFDAPVFPVSNIFFPH